MTPLQDLIAALTEYKLSDTYKVFSSYECSLELSVVSSVPSLALTVNGDTIIDTTDLSKLLELDIVNHPNIKNNLSIDSSKLSVEMDRMYLECRITVLTLASYNLSGGYTHA